MTKKLLVILIAAVTLIAGADIAMAARGGKGNGGGSGGGGGGGEPSGSIELADAGAGIAAAGAADAAYGDTVHFDTEVNNASSKAQVYITVICTQGNDVVYQVSGDRAAGFELTDRAGLDWDGNPADCEGWLIHRVKKGRGYQITYLGMDPFAVG